MKIQEPRMNIIISFIRRMRSHDQIKVLGRWEITYCNNTLDKKIDLANEDNCGICYSTKYHNYNINPLIISRPKNPIIDLE